MSDSNGETPSNEDIAAEEKPKGSWGKFMATKFKYVSAYSAIQTVLLYILAIMSINSRKPCVGVTYAEAGSRADPWVEGVDTTVAETWDPVAATGGVSYTLTLLLIVPLVGLLCHKYRKLELTIKVPTIIYIMGKDAGRIWGRSGVYTWYTSEVEVTKKFLRAQRDFFDAKEKRATAKANLKLQSRITDPEKLATFKKELAEAEKRDHALELAYQADLEADRQAAKERDEANHKFYLSELKMGNVKEEIQKLFASGKYEPKDKKDEPIKDPDGNAVIIKFNDVTDGKYGEPTTNEFGDTLFGSPGDERWGFPTEDEFGEKLFGSDLATVSAAWEKLVRAKERACLKGATDEKFPWHHTITIYHGAWLMDIYLWIKGCIIEFGGKKFNWMREEWRLKQFWKMVQYMAKIMQFVGLFMLLGMEWEMMGWESDADGEARTDFKKIDDTFGTFKDGAQTEKVDPDCTGDDCEWLGCRLKPMVDLSWDSDADGKYDKKGEQGVMIGTGIALNKQILEILILDTIILGGLIYWLFNKCVESKNYISRVQHTVWFDLQMAIWGYAMVPPVMDVEGSRKKKLKKQKFEHDAYTLVWNNCIKKKPAIYVNEVPEGEDGKQHVKAGYEVGFKYSWIGANGKLYADEETCKNDSERIKWCEETWKKADKYIHEKKGKKPEAGDGAADTTAEDTTTTTETKAETPADGEEKKEKAKNPVAAWIDSNMDSFKLSGLFGKKAQFEVEKKIKEERAKDRAEISAEGSGEDGGAAAVKEEGEPGLKHPADQEWKRYPILRKLFEKKDPKASEKDEPPKEIGQSFISADLEFMWEYRIWYLNTRPERALWRDNGHLSWAPVKPEKAKQIYPKEGRMARKYPQFDPSTLTMTDPWEENEKLTWVWENGYTAKEEELYQIKVKEYLKIKEKGDVRFKHVKDWKECDIDDPHRAPVFAISLPILAKARDAKIFLIFSCTFGLFCFSPVRFLMVYFAYVDKNYGVEKFMKYNLTWYFIWGFIWMFIAAISLKLGGFGIGVGDISFKSLDLGSIARLDKIFTTGFAMGAAPNMNFAVSGQLFNSVIQGISSALDMCAGLGDAKILPGGVDVDTDALKGAAEKAAEAAKEAAEKAANQAAESAQAAAEGALESAQAAAEGVLASAESGVLNAMAQSASLAAAAGNVAQAAQVMLDFKSPPVDGDKPEGAPDDWSEKIQKVQGKISEMCVMELPNLQEAMNSMDKLVSVDGVYRSKYVETKEALTQEDGTLKTWPNNQPSAKARMYFVGILYAAEELFKDDFPEFIITGTKAEEMINNAVEKGLMEACRLEAAEASGYNALKEAVEETVEKAKQMKEDFEAKLQELQDAARAKLEGMKDEIKQFIQDKKTEVLGKMKTMVEEEAKKWVEENIGPKVEEGVEDWVDELGLGSTSWLPMDKLKNFAVERIMGLFAALIDQLLNGKFNPKELVADATANPLAGMTPKDMLAAGFEASKECGAYDGLHEAIEEAKEKVEEVKQEVTDAVNEVKEQVQDAVNEVKDAVDEATEGAGLGTTDEMAEKAKEELAELKAPEGKKSFFSIDTFIDRADTLPSDQYKIEKKKAQFLLFQTFLIGTAMNFLFQIGTHPGFPFGKYNQAHYT